MQETVIVFLGGFINIIGALQLSQFGFHTLDDSIAFTYGTVITTLWFNHTIYQCSLKPINYDTDYSCDSSRWTVVGVFDSGCHTSEYKMMIDNSNSGDALEIDYINFYDSNDNWYGADTYCAVDDAITSTKWIKTPNICESGHTYYSALCIDNQGVDCAPGKQLIYLDITQPNIYPSTSQLIDGSDVTVDVFTCEPTTTPPSNRPTETPTNYPTYSPTNYPTFSPTNNPTYSPSDTPTNNPIQTPDPTFLPTNYPTYLPSDDPTFSPTNFPTYSPTYNPSFDPIYTKTPTISPTQSNVSEVTEFSTSTMIFVTDNTLAIMDDTTFWESGVGIGVIIALVAIIILILICGIYIWLRSNKLRKYIDKTNQKSLKKPLISSDDNIYRNTYMDNVINRGVNINTDGYMDNVNKNEINILIQNKNNIQKEEMLAPFDKNDEFNQFTQEGVLNNDINSKNDIIITEDSISSSDDGDTPQTKK